MMAQHTNSTHLSEGWRLDHNFVPYRESLIVIFILLYGLKVQVQRNNRQRNLRIIQRLSGRTIHLLDVLMNWCAYFQDYSETSIEKKRIPNARVAPHESEVLVKVEKRKTEKHPWDIANEIMKEREQAALAVKWAVIPIEVLTDEHFLNVLHSIEEITDTTPLRDAARQLPKQLYGIIQAHEQMTRIPAEVTDQLIFDVAKTYYYSVIHSLCKLIKSIQQGQRTTLITLAKIIQDQRDEMKEFGILSKFTEEIKQMQQQIVQFRKRMNTQLERMDKKTSVASVTISELRIRVHLLEAALETNLDYDPHEDQPMWMSLEELVELNPPEDNVLFHEEQGKLKTPNGQHCTEADSTIGGESRENQDNTNQRLSSPRMYLPGGAERSDSSLSSNSTGEEETVEEELARFFSNPSYRATDPILQQPEEPEEDWGGYSSHVNTYPHCSRTSATNDKSCKKAAIFTKKERKEEAG